VPHEVGAVEHEHVKVNVEIERGAKALDQRHGTGHTGRAREPRLLEYVRRDRPVDDAEYLSQRVRIRGKQESQRERQRQHPLAQRLFG
jgi:hypothetical protein